jgi:hypothetical protein
VDVVALLLVCKCGLFACPFMGWRSKQPNHSTYCMRLLVSWVEISYVVSRYCTREYLSLE